MDTLWIEPRASRMLSGCDTTTPRAVRGDDGYNVFLHGSQVVKPGLVARPSRQAFSPGLVAPRVLLCVCVSLRP